MVTCRSGLVRSGCRSYVPFVALLQLIKFIAFRYAGRIAHGSPGKKATLTAFTHLLAAMVGDLSTKLEALPNSMIWRTGLMQHSLRSFLRLRLRLEAYPSELVS